MMSSIFFWWFESLGNCRNLNDQDIGSFRLSLSATLISRLSSLVADLMADMDANAERFQRNQKRTGLVVYDQYYVGKSKSFIDSIDEVLAEALDLSSDELDYIKSYSGKYRSGTEGDDEE
jgi:hypothetical protein